MRKIIVMIVSAFIIANLPLFSGEEVKELTLKEAIFHALKNNIDIQIEKTSTENARLTKIINDTAFIPTFSISTGTSETNTPSSGILSGADVSINERFYANFKLEQKYALGGTFSIELSNSRSKSNSIFSTINPVLNSELNFTVSQPLLKGFGTFATKKDILISMNEHVRSKHQLKNSIMDLIYNVEDYYWNLVYRIQSMEATQKSLDRARKLLKQNELRVKVGVSAPIDILEAKAEVASYESQIIQAEKDVQTAENNLKKILNITLDKHSIKPLDTPEKTVIPVDFNGFLLEALNNRPDIKRAKLDMENNRIRVKYARNQMLPNLQLTASYYTTGQGGDQLIYGPGSIFEARPVIGVISKDVWNTINDTISNIYKNFSVQLQLTLPLSLKKEKAELMQSKMNLKSSFLNLKKVENDIYAEVKDVVKELETNSKLVESNKIALKLEEQKLKAEEKKLSVGLSTNYQVLNYQRDFANAQTNSLKSVVDYMMTIAKINRALGRTFQVYKISFAGIVTDGNK